MKITTLINGLLFATLTFYTANNKAATVPAEAPISLGTYQRNFSTNEVFDVDVNFTNGDYVVCWAVSTLGSVFCTHRNEAGIEQKFIPINSAFPDGQNLSVEFNDAGDIYVLWSTDSDARVTAYDSVGSQLFAPVSINGNPNAWDTVSMALTPSGFWVFGTRSATTAETNYGRRFDSTGNLIQNLNVGIINNHTNNNCQAGITSNRSGDLLLSWVKRVPENNLECLGNVVGITFRESGTAISDVIEVSGTSDPAYYANPQAIADESGEFVIVWDEDDPQFQPPQIPTACPACNHSYFSRITTYNGGTGLPAEELIQGIRPRIGSGESGKNFVVITDKPIGPGFCENASRWALRGELTPEIFFEAMDCDRLIMKVDLLSDDSMLLVYTTENNDDVTVWAKQYHEPVEIEVGDVTLLEGNPSSGQGNSAVVSIGLSKAHPANETITVNYFTRDITANQGEDYALVTGTASFAAGEILQEILVPITPDTKYERTETFSFNLELADNSVIRKNKAIISIANDDNSPPVLNDCDNVGGLCKVAAEPPDGQSSFVEIVLSIDEPQELDIGFTYQTEDDTATAGEDYLTSGGSVQIAAGATETSIIIPLLGDLVNEGAEAFKIKFSTTSQITIPEPILSIGITDGTTCSAELSPTGHNIPLEGGSRSFDIQTLPDCEWNLTTAESWIQITSPLTGTGSSTVNYTVPVRANPEVESRLGSIEVNLNSPASSISHTVIQDGDPSLCDFDIGQTQFDFNEAASSGSIQVSAIEDCVWEVFSDVPWLTIDSPLAPVSGNGVVEFSVSANTSGVNVVTSSRSTVLDAPFAVTVNQTGCDFSLGNEIINLDDMPHEDISTTVNAPDAAGETCPWSAQSQVSWILVTAGNSGQGAGEVVMNVLENPSVTPRVGTVLIGNDTFTVNQDGQPCIYDINTDPLSVCPDGTSDQLGVLATAGCSWELSSSDSWLQINTNSSGVGDEIAEYSVEANNTLNDRSAMLSLISGDMATQLDKPIQQAGYLVYQDFTDNTLPEQFEFTAGNNWQVNSGVLESNFLGSGLGIAFDGSDTAFCSDCKVEGEIQLNSFSSNPQQNIGLVGWFQDVNNLISLTMDEYLNKWRLSLVVGGQETFVEYSVASLVPNQNYQLSISYDESYIYGRVDGSLIMQLPHDLVSPPRGYPGFWLNNASGQLDKLKVTGTSGDSDLIFSQSFELTTFDPPSVCSL